MYKDSPLIHLFETNRGQYIFDVNTNAIIKIQKNVFENLRNNFSLNSSYKIYECEQVKELKDRGFLSSKKVKEVVHPLSDMLEFYMSSKIKMVILQVTQQCNLRCEYCTYSGSYINRTHQDARMNIELAKKGVEFLFDNSRDVDSVHIGFYGGEPLIEFELIKDIILYSEKISNGKRLTFGVTTNGTLLNDKIINFFNSHNVLTTISLDGPKEVHDKNRKFASSGCGSFEKIKNGLENIKHNYPDFLSKVMFNAVLDPNNDFSCINDFFTSYDIVKDLYLNVSDITDDHSVARNTNNEDHETQLKYELFKLYLSKLNKLDKKSVSKLVERYYDHLRKILVDSRGFSSSMPDKGHPSGPCIPGAQRLFIDVNGNFYPCERVSEKSKIMQIGHIDKGFDYDKIRSLLNIGEITSENCKDCWAFKFCTLCAVSADGIDKLSVEKKLFNCKVVKYSLEEHLKDYCMLNEFGYSFEDSNIFKIVEAQNE
ncbi:UNVERIFIED_CONTAM: uncharacterized protein Cloal_1366 [Acetivibrio alkalicellulosi]